MIGQSRSPRLWGVLLISDEYLVLNRELHSRGGYGVSGAKWADEVHGLADMMGAISVLDYGCGKGLLKRALIRHGGKYAVREYDPAIAGKDARPAPADVVVCGDVLEHIEPDCLEAVLDDLRKLAVRAVFLVIATRPAVKTLADGRNAHLIVAPAWVWMQHLGARWQAMHFRGNDGEFVFVGRPQ